ncbi:carbohydrate binding domain-containing protein [Pseudoduganella sp. HUAS MS19]
MPPPCPGPPPATTTASRNTWCCATAATSYTDNALTPSTSYSYTVKARDAAGNTGPASAARTLTTAAGNLATVYYRLPGGWSRANVHYSPAGGTWTTVPGVPMAPACSGWMSYRASLGAANSWQAVFNNGSGNWDNNGGKNYALGSGISAVSAGTVTSANPCAGADTTPPSAPAGLAGSNVGSQSATLSWAAASDNIGVAGYNILRNNAQIAATSATTYSDTGLAPATSYSYMVQAYDAAGNTSPASAALAVTTTAAAACQVSFTIANANTLMGQNLYVVGNGAALGNWSPANGFALAIQGSGANVPWSGTLTLPAATAIEYKYVKWNGSTAAWEGSQGTASGNREFSTPAACSSPLQRNDGTFKS